MKPEDEKELHEFVMWEGTKAAIVGGVLSTAASFYSQKSFPFYRGIKFPFKALLVATAITGSFFTAADVSITKAERVLAERKILERGGFVAPKISESPQSLKHWVLDNKYYIVGFGWMAVAGGTFLYQWKRKDISVPQKVINARLSSQVMALAGVSALAGNLSIVNKIALTATEPPKPKIDYHYESVISQTSNQ